MRRNLCGLLAGAIGGQPPALGAELQQTGSRERGLA